MARKPKTAKIDLDPTLQPRIEAALERGLTIQMACAECGITTETYYQYIKKYPDFSDMVTRAQQTALAKAVGAFRSGLEGQKVNQVEIDEFSETRLDKKGQPYVYKKQTTKKRVIETPPDWRAGEAFLKRRDPQNWSEKLFVEFDLDLAKVLEWAKLLQDFDLKASDVMETMLRKLHEQKARQHVDT